MILVMVAASHVNCGRTKQVSVGLEFILKRVTYKVVLVRYVACFGSPKNDFLRKAANNAIQAITLREEMAKQRIG
jgi:hypothetical protein